MKSIKQLASDLREWADHPAASGFVPIGPDTLRDLAGLLDPSPPERLIALEVGPTGDYERLLQVRFNRAVTTQELNQLHYHINNFGVPRRSFRPKRIESDDYYRVVLDESSSEGCTECGDGRFWTIVFGTGEEETQVSSSWDDQEIALSVCEFMNFARSEALPIAV